MSATANGQYQGQSQSEFDDNSFDFSAPPPEEMAGGGGDGKFCKAPGTYHLMVENMKFNPTKNNSSEILHGVKVTFTILAGTTPDQVGKTIETMMFHGKPSDKDQGKFAAKRQAALFIALGLIQPSQLGQPVKINPSMAGGRQCVATFAERPYTNQNGVETKGLELHYADIWHVDDPRAAKFPRDAEAVALIDASNRLPVDAFACLLGQGGGGNGSHGSTNHQQSQSNIAKAVSSSSSTSDDLGDL